MLRKTFLVTIDAAAGGVKDLEHYNGPAPAFSPQILRYRSERQCIVAQNDSERVLRMTVRGRSERQNTSVTYTKKEELRKQLFFTCLSIRYMICYDIVTLPLQKMKTY